MEPRKSLPIVSECQGCGVCCLHMGYPPFIGPTAERPGEHWWNVSPEQLRDELDEIVPNYPARIYDGTVESLDGPCLINMHSCTVISDQISNIKYQISNIKYQISNIKEPFQMFADHDAGCALKGHQRCNR